MSASLVGSEMCIRDRCKRDAPSASLWEVPYAHPVLVTNCSLQLGHPLRCLLYTSDAADDM
eukprot:6144515-Alexandrium_andersonii.AAC.1